MAYASFVFSSGLVSRALSGIGWGAILGYMHVLPRQRRRLTPAMRAARIVLSAMARFISMKCAGYVLLAYMPQTFAAAITSTSGLCSWKNSSV